MKNDLNPPRTTSPVQLSKAVYHRRQLLTLLVLMLMLALGLGGALWWKYRTPSLARYQPLIKALDDGSLDGESIALANRFPGILPKDVMYLHRRDDGSYVALLPTYYGQGLTFTGLLYSSRPLRTEDTYNPSGYITFKSRQIDFANYRHIFIDSRINANWYKVSYHGVK